MYNPSGPSCMRWNVRGFLKINFIGVSSWQRSVSGEYRLCRATLHRHLGGRAHSRLTRDSPEVGIVPECVPSEPLLNSDALRDRANISAQDCLAPDRLPATMSSARKNPVVALSVPGAFSPNRECIQHSWMSRHRLLR